jgi:S1-C subfamily serine protease
MKQYLLVILAWGLAVVGAQAQVPAEAAALQKTVHQVLDGAEPSIVALGISRSEQFADFGEGPSNTPGKLGGFNVQRFRMFDPRAELAKKLDLAADAVPDSYASAVVIDSTGLLLTTYHAIDKATKIYARGPGLGKGSYCDIVAADARADLAVLRLINPPGNLKAIKLVEKYSTRKGDWIITLGNPFNAGFKDGSPSASWGIVSNLKRRQIAPATDDAKPKPLNQYATLIQTDARTNIGCSGGAVLNLNGELVGLTTALPGTAGGEGAAGYAIPMDRLYRKIITTLVDGREVEYGYLGVRFSVENVPGQKGVMISDSPAGLPAAKAGLRGGSTIVEINGNPINDRDDLIYNINAGLADQVVEIVARVGIRNETYKVRLAKTQNNEPFIASIRPKPVHGLRVDYTSTGGTEGFNVSGVLVRELQVDSPAAKALGEWNNRARLIVTQVNGEAIESPTDFYRLTEKQASIELTVVEAGRRGETKRIKLP